MSIDTAREAIRAEKDAELTKLWAEPEEREAEDKEDESLQEALDRMDGYVIDNECGAR